MSVTRSRCSTTGDGSLRTSSLLAFFATAKVKRLHNPSSACPGAAGGRRPRDARGDLQSGALDRKQQPAGRALLEEQGHRLRAATATLDRSLAAYSRRWWMVTETGAAVPLQVGHRELLEQDHRDVAASFRGRAVQRIGELLHLITQAALLDGRGDDRQTVLKPLAFPEVLKPFDRSPKPNQNRKRSGLP